MTQVYFLVVALFIDGNYVCSAANILFINFPSYSHVAGPANVGKFLQDQGHNVAIAITPQLKARLENKGVALLIYNCLGDFPEGALIAKLNLEAYFELNSKWSSFGSKGRLTLQLLTSVATKIVQDINFRKDIENFKPDLIIMDSSAIAIMLTLIPYKLDIPFVMMGVGESAHSTRTPIVPTVFSLKSFFQTAEMTFPQRLVNTLFQLILYRYSMFINTSLIYDYVPEKPYISPIDLQTKAQLWIVRQHYLTGYNPPSMPNVKRVGHLQTFKTKPLSNEFKRFMDSGEEGVVVVTFGSVIGFHIPSNVVDKLLVAFEKTKYKFILQTSLEQYNQTDKLLPRKWIPQFDLLNHRNVKLFITHCGSNGVQEGLLAGVPMLGFPVFGDQPFHAGIIARKGFGLSLELNSFTVQELVESIEEIITNPIYKANVKKASAILKSERVPPIEEAAFWINHVLEFGGEHLRSPAQDVPLWKYLGLDIIAFFFILWHVILYFVVVVPKRCISRCCQRKKNKLKTSRKEKTL